MSCWEEIKRIVDEGGWRREAQYRAVGRSENWGRGASRNVVSIISFPNVEIGLCNWSAKIWAGPRPSGSDSPVWLHGTKFSRIRTVVCIANTQNLFINEKANKTDCDEKTIIVFFTVRIRTSRYAQSEASIFLPRPLCFCVGSIGAGKRWNIFFLGYIRRLMIIALSSWTEESETKDVQRIWVRIIP